MKCDIYRSDKKQGMYLYIEQPNNQKEPNPVFALNTLPIALQGVFGLPSWVMSLEITSERKLAQVKGEQVLQSIAQKGYFLQLPPEGLINPNAVAPEGLRGA